MSIKASMHNLDFVYKDDFGGFVTAFHAGDYPFGIDSMPEQSRKKTCASEGYWLLRSSDWSVQSELRHSIMESIF